MSRLVLLLILVIGFLLYSVNRISNSFNLSENNTLLEDTLADDRTITPNQVVTSPTPDKEIAEDTKAAEASLAPPEVEPRISIDETRNSDSYEYPISQEQHPEVAPYEDHTQGSEAEAYPTPTPVPAQCDPAVYDCDWQRDAESMPEEHYQMNQHQQYYDQQYNQEELPQQPDPYQQYNDQVIDPNMSPHEPDQEAYQSY